MTIERLRDTPIAEGDIIVTAVAHHFAIGRVGRDGRTQEHLASQRDRSAALALACRLAGPDHHVFLVKSAGDSLSERYDCRSKGRRD